MAGSTAAPAARRISLRRPIFIDVSPGYVCAPERLNDLSGSCFGQVEALPSRPDLYGAFTPFSAVRKPGYPGQRSGRSGRPILWDSKPACYLTRLRISIAQVTILDRNPFQLYVILGTGWPFHSHAPLAPCVPVQTGRLML